MTTTSAARSAIAVTGLQKSSGDKVVLDGIWDSRLAWVRESPGSFRAMIRVELSQLLCRVAAIPVSGSTVA